MAMQLTSNEDHNPNSLMSKVAQVQGYCYTHPVSPELSKLLSDVWNGLHEIEKATKRPPIRTTNDMVTAEKYYKCRAKIYEAHLDKIKQILNGENDD